MTIAVTRCVYCDAAGAQQVACESPVVQEWWCPRCDGRWWFSEINPHRSVEQLTGEAILRAVSALAEQAPTLSDGQLRARLITLLAALDTYARNSPDQITPSREQGIAQPPGRDGVPAGGHPGPDHSNLRQQPGMAGTPQWYLRSAELADAHLGQLRAEGTVLARCGLNFTPQPELFAPGPRILHPPPGEDDARCCPACLAAPGTVTQPSSQASDDAEALRRLMDRL